MSLVSDEIKKQELCAKIINTLEEHPEWVGDAVGAITAGINCALHKKTLANNELQVALVSALALTENKRLRQDMIDHLNETILQRIKKHQSLCDIERDFIRKNEDAGK